MYTCQSVYNVSAKIWNIYATKYMYTDIVKCKCDLILEN